MRTFFRFRFYQLGTLLSFFFAIPSICPDHGIINNATQAHTQICNVFNAMFGVLIFVSVIMVMWAAYLYVTARDDAEQVTEAKKALFYAALGIVAALLATGISDHGCKCFPERNAGVQGC